MKKIINKAIFVTFSIILVLLLIAMPVMAATYFGILLVQETDGNSYTKLPVIFLVNNSWMVDQGFMDSTGLDTRVQSGGSNIPHMVTDNTTLVAVDVPAYSSKSLIYLMGEDLQASMPTIVGQDGYVTVADNNTTLELGDNFTVLVDGYWFTDAGDDKNAVYKEDAFRLYVSSDETVRASILTSVNTTSYQVNANTDDASKQWDGAVWSLATNANNFAGYNTNVSFQLGCGMRFNNVIIPQGATIASANITFTALANLANDDVNSRLTGEDADNPVTFSTLANYDARPHTTANITWDAIPAWTQNTVYVSPEIKTIIQEIVGRPNWSSGNSIVIFWEDEEGRSTAINATYRSAYPHDNTPVKAPILNIDYYPTMVTALDAVSGEHEIIANTDNTSLFFGIAKDNVNADYPITDNLTLNAPLWHNELDVSPFTTKDANERTATVTGAVWSSDGYIFDGTNPDFITLPTFGALDITDEITVEGWMWYPIAASDKSLFGAKTPAEDRHLTLRSVAFEVQPDGVAIGDRAHIEYGAPITGNQWHHLVGTYNGTAIRVFIDLVEKTGPTQTTAGAFDPTDVIQLACKGDSATWPLTGIIGEARIYGRALTPAEISANYYATKWKYDGSDEYFHYNLFPSAVPDNANIWNIMRNNVLSWADNITFVIDGVEVLYFAPNDIIAGTVLPDRAGGDNPGTFIWGSNPAGISVNFTAFLPVTEAKAPAFVLGSEPIFITATPNITSEFTVVPPTGTFPLAPVIAAVATATDTPPQLPLLIIAGFVILAASFCVSYIFRLHGSGTIFVKILVIAAFMGIFVALGNFGIDFWMLVVFLIISIAMAMASKQLGWT